MQIFDRTIKEILNQNLEKLETHFKSDVISTMVKYILHTKKYSEILLKCLKKIHQEKTD